MVLLLRLDEHLSPRCLPHKSFKVAATTVKKLYPVAGPDADHVERVMGFFRR